MESIERKEENYAIVFNVNLNRATLNEAVEFKEFLVDVINNSDKDLVVNLSTCEHLDSTFLGVLVSSYKRMKSKNRTLVIIEPIDQSSIYLTLNSIGKIFPLYTSVQAALEDIENKKLLEKEINNENNEFSPEQIQVTEKLVEASVNFSEEQNENLSPEPIVEELQNHEFQAEAFQLVESENTFEPVVEEHKLVSGKSWNLIDYKEEENDHLINTEDKSEQIVQEVEYSGFNASQSEEQQMVVSHSRVAEDDNFGNGQVKWEFGFSS